MARTNPLSAAFWADAPADAPGSYAALEARRRIAEQIAKKSPFPKTLGEGLTYFGESLAERARMNELADAEVKQANIDREAMGGPAAAMPLPPASTTPVVMPAPVTQRAAPAAAPQASADPNAFYGVPVGTPSALAVNADPADEKDVTPPDDAQRARLAALLTPTPMMRPGGMAADLQPLPPINAATAFGLADPATRFNGASGEPVPTPASQPVSGERVPLPPPRPVFDRNRQIAELQDNPALTDRIRTIARGESADPREQQIVAETIFNRAAARDQPLEQVTRQYTGPRSTGYYPASTFGRGQISEDALAPVLRGSDVGGQALGFSPTGNASADVAANGIRTGRYNAAGRLPGSGETFVQQERPAQVERLAGTRLASLGGAPNIAAAAADNAPIATDITPAPQRVAEAGTPRVIGPAIPSSALTPAPRPPMAPNVAGAAVPEPIAPRDPGPEPRLPAPTLEMQHWERAARNPSLSPDVRNIASAKYKELQTAQREDFTRHWTVWKAEEMKARDPATALDLRHKQLTNVETQRKLEGEGFLPLSKEEMAVLPKAAEGQVIYKNRLGELKFGPAPPATAAESGAQVLQKKMAEHFVGQMEAGNTAADDLRTLAQMRGLAARVNTGPEAVIKQFAGQMGIKTEGVSNIEALNAVINRVVPQQRVPGTGSTSDFDAAMFRASVPALMNTPGGNALIMDTMESAARNKLARAEVAGKVVSGELSIPDGTRELLKLQGEAKTISDRVRAHIEATGGKVPDVSTTSDNSAAQEWLRNNPNDPKAAAVRRKLGM